MYQLTQDLVFPHPKLSDEHGLLAFGGDLSSERLLLAYRNGIFPWFDESSPILWWSPDPRMVLFPSDLRISKSMKTHFNQKRFRVTYNKAFPNVIDACAGIERKGQQGTWITKSMRKAYIELYDRGVAKSVEVWSGNELVGGLYGVLLKDQKIFCGESMFARKTDASKYGFIVFVRKLADRGIKLIDCQIHTKHLESLGAREIPRELFLKYLHEETSGDR